LRCSLESPGIFPKHVSLSPVCIFILLTIPLVTETGVAQSGRFSENLPIICEPPNFRLIHKALIICDHSVFKNACSVRGAKMEEKDLSYGILAHVVRNGGFLIVLVIRYSAIPPHCPSLHLLEKYVVDRKSMQSRQPYSPLSVYPS
jgi:hypothetical protein